MSGGGWGASENLNMENVFFISALDQSFNARLILHCCDTLAPFRDIDGIKKTIKELNSNPEYIAGQINGYEILPSGRDLWLQGDHPVLSGMIINSIWSGIQNYILKLHSRVKYFLGGNNYYEDIPQVMYVRAISVYRGDKKNEGKTLKINYYIRFKEDINGRITKNADPMNSKPKLNLNAIYLFNFYHAQIKNNEIVDMPYLPLTHSQFSSSLRFRNHSWFEEIYPDEKTFSEFDGLIQNFIDVIGGTDYRPPVVNLGLSRREAIECMFFKNSDDECNRKLAKNAFNTIPFSRAAWRKCIAPVPFCIQPEQAGLIKRTSYFINEQTCNYDSKIPEFECDRDSLKRLEE